MTPKGAAKATVVTAAVAWVLFCVYVNIATGEAYKTKAYDYGVVVNTTQELNKHKGHVYTTQYMQIKLSDGSVVQRQSGNFPPDVGDRVKVTWHYGWLEGATDYDRPNMPRWASFPIRLGAAFTNMFVFFGTAVWIFCALIGWAFWGETSIIPFCDNLNNKGTR